MGIRMLYVVLADASERKQKEDTQTKIQKSDGWVTEW
jgi:hypothetical protein